MTLLDAMELRLRRVYYRLPVLVCAAVVGLAVALALFALFGLQVLGEGSRSSERGFPVFQAVFGSLMASFFAWWAERNKRAEFPDADDRLAFDRLVLAPAIANEGEGLTEKCRKQLRTIADNKMLGFMGFVLLAPAALIIVIIPASKGEAIWPSILFVSVLFALVAIGVAQGIHRGRNAERILGISQSNRVS